MWTQRGYWTTATLVLGVCTVMAAAAAAQTLSADERQSLIKLHTDRGGRAGDVEVLIHVADETSAKGLPAESLTNKIREGLAKHVDPKRIEPVLRQMASDLETANRLVRDLVSPPVALAGRNAAITLLAESLTSGLTPEEVRQLDREVDQTGPMLGAESLSAAAKGLALIKDARLPVTDGSAVIAEAARNGYGAGDLVDLGREVKRRERDYQSGRATLRALRDAIARGDRLDQLFRDGRTPAERVDLTRPAERPERPSRPETPQRPERVERPVRPDVPERPATGRD
jgi:hypothetical protein